MTFIPHIKTANNVTVYIDGQPQVVAVGTPQYDLVLAAIDAGDIEAARDAINIRQSIVKQAGGRITLDGNTLMYDDRPLHGALVNRILEIVHNAGNAGPMLLFLENLMENPSLRAVEELYGFLEACLLPITEDGHFLAYKKVRNDYMDIYSGTMDNSVGQVLEMPRNAVDEDKNRTCSSGLHFCAKSYLSHFGSWNSSSNRVVVVKINPRDVVAIPSDYNNAKGRTCRYEVVDELDTSVGSDADSTASIRDSYEDKYSYSTSIWPDDELEEFDDEFDDELDGLMDDEDASDDAPQVRPGTHSLTDSQVRDIRNMLDDDWTIVGIARAMGTSERTVARIRDGETYTHVR